MIFDVLSKQNRTDLENTNSLHWIIRQKSIFGFGTSIAFRCDLARLPSSLSCAADKQVKFVAKKPEGMTRSRQCPPAIADRKTCRTTNYVTCPDHNVHCRDNRIWNSICSGENCCKEEKMLMSPSKEGMPWRYFILKKPYGSVRRTPWNGASHPVCTIIFFSLLFISISFELVLELFLVSVLPSLFRPRALLLVAWNTSDIRDTRSYHIISNLLATKYEKQNSGLPGENCFAFRWVRWFLQKKGGRSGTETSAARLKSLQMHSEYFSARHAVVPSNSAECHWFNGLYRYAIRKCISRCQYLLPPSQGQSGRLILLLEGVLELESTIKQSLRLPEKRFQSTFYSSARICFIK